MKMMRKRVRAFSEQGDIGGSIMETSRNLKATEHRKHICETKGEDDFGLHMRLDQKETSENVRKKGLEKP